MVSCVLGIFVEVEILRTGPLEPSWETLFLHDDGFSILGGLSTGALWTEEKQVEGHSVTVRRTVCSVTLRYNAVSCLKLKQECGALLV